MRTISNYGHIGARPPRSTNYSRLATSSLRSHQALSTSSRFTIWFIATAVFMPYSIAVFLGELKLTPAKVALTIFVLPAALSFLSAAARGERRIMASDFFVVATSAWMIAGPVLASGSDALQGAAFQSFEVIASYIIARSFFFGESSVEQFIRALKVVTVVVIGLGALDTLTQQFVTNNAVLAIFPPPVEPQLTGHFSRSVFGINVLRATSTFDHPIMFGTFCAVMSAIFLFYEKRTTTRLFYVGLCVFGCLLSLSSAALLTLIVVICSFCYDRAFKKYATRWKLFSMAFFGLFFLFFLVSNNPFGWIIRNLTLDSQTGYFRVLIWNLAIDNISLHPFVGTGFKPTGNYILDSTIDSLWLGKAVIYGIPMIVFLILAGVVALIPSRAQSRIRSINPDIDSMCLAFSTAVMSFGLVGLTATYWNAPWLFAIMCLGVRVSLKEYCLISATVARSRKRSQSEWLRAH
jgi:hypothetical protein